MSISTDLPPNVNSEKVSDTDLNVYIPAAAVFDATLGSGDWKALALCGLLASGQSLRFHENQANMATRLGVRRETMNRRLARLGKYITHRDAKTRPHWDSAHSYRLKSEEDYIIIPARALYDDKLKGVDLCVLAYFTKRAGRGGFHSERIAEIAGNLGRGESTVEASIARLKRAGYLCSMDVGRFDETRRPDDQHMYHIRRGEPAGEDAFRHAIEAWRAGGAGQ